LRIIIIILVFLTSTLFLGSAFASIESSFSNWIGFWEGDCQLSSPVQGVQKVNTSLNITEGSKPDRLGWQLIYQETGPFPKQVRNYEMVTIDESAGHYMIDERNGLLLDSFLKGDAIYSTFTIKENLIFTTHVLIEKNKMLATYPSFNSNPVRKTCVTGQPDLCAHSFLFQAAQKCILTRTKF
jgi:hypothetical protein